MKFRALQDCRALAALLVVAFHASANLVKGKYLGEVAQPLYSALWFGGDAGVAFFFVLSGFIIHHVHKGDLGHPSRLRAYAVKRAVRVYPAYVVTYLAMSILVLAVSEWRAGFPADAFIWLKGLLLIPQDPQTVGGTGAPLVIVAWSLHHELLFYVLMAGGILNRSALVLTSLLLTCCVAVQQWHPQDAFWMRFLGAQHQLLFAMGVGASMAFSARAHIRYSGTVALAGIAALAFGLTAWQASMARLHYSRVPFDLAYGLSSGALIFALARMDQAKAKAGLNARGCLPGSWGDASYALYLSHFPVVAALSKVVTPLNGGTLLGAAMSLCLIVGTCLVVGIQFHQRVERPLMRWLGNSLLTPRHGAAAVSL